MKICVITLSRSRNYGAVLQAFALCKVLEDRGHNVQLIDYITERYIVDSAEFVDRSIGNKKWAKLSICRTIWKCVLLKNIKEAHKVFWDFLKENVTVSKTYYTNEELKGKFDDFDIAISGSDQIWNSDFTWNNCVDYPYFLDFINEEVKKISYASSFGKKEISVKEGKEIYKLLMNFSYVSVREETGRKILENLGIKSTVVLDPTLICSDYIWNKMASKRICNRKYIILFQIKPNKELLTVAKKTAKNNNLKLVILTPTKTDAYKIRKKVIAVPSVYEWLSYFKYAECIITDSFHATSFSVIFNKEFVVAAKGPYEDRLDTLLKQLQLTDHLINKYYIENGYNFDKCKINYNGVNGRLNILRNKSISWLDQAINRGE